MMILQQFDKEEFLKNYWQKKPLLIKHTGEEFQDPISADELAGLACEEVVESRIVTTTADGEFKLQNGPFDDSVFTEIGDRRWTLLVQAVDQYLTEVDALKSYFNFIPHWRIDDVMVSFACDEGGVGPHFDQYDVFLIQGMGSRRWQLGQRCSYQTPLRPNSDLRLVDNFIPEREYILKPGDILYLPPRVAHYGISLGNSLCYSVGFRAPSMADIVQGYTDALIMKLSDDERYVDPDGEPVAHPGELTQQVIDSSYSKLMFHLADESSFTEWFGKFVTTSKYPDLLFEPKPELTFTNIINMLNKRTHPVVIKKNSVSRFAFHSTPKQLKLFVDGHCFTCNPSQLDAIRNLCEVSWEYPLELTFLGDNPDAIQLLVILLNQGSLIVTD